ncbi:MAG: B12-binding domain-containing radical SAM protein [Pyrinomonadaceae bacterium]
MQDARRDSPHLGVFLLLGHLNRAALDCDLVDWVANPQMSCEDLANAVAEYEVVFFSSNSMNWGVVRRAAGAIRKTNPAVKLCVGGPHPTMYPESVERSCLFDAYFRGEGDRHIAFIYETLVSGKRPRSTLPPGLWLRNVSLTRPEVHLEHNLAELDWRVDYPRIQDQAYLTLPVETSRGCKYRCAFCSIPSQMNWRAYPVEIAVKQLDYVYQHLERSKYKKISIIDDTFTTNHQRIIDLCSRLPTEKFGGRLMYDATLLDLRNTELVASIAPFTSDLLIGAEVSTVEDAKRITKSSSPRLIERAAKNLRDAGISNRAVFSFIIGFPWHTVDDCLHTVTFLTNLILDYGIRVYLQWYWPMPGSAIWRQLEKEQRVSIQMSDTPGFYRSQEWFYSVRQITPEDLRRVDERIRPLQLCLTLGRLGTRHRPLEYSLPDLEQDGKGWETRRNPFIGPDLPNSSTTIGTCS